MKKLVFCFLLACSTPEGTFTNTERAAASLALDFSECVKTDFTQLALAGMLSKDAAFASAEKCGIASVTDGLALLVAAFNDVKAYIIASHKPAAADAGAP